MATYPFSPFPRGWFQVAYSDELPAGGVLPIHYFGKELVLFRTATGSAHVLDAHCPHLGAHFGYGGRVEGELLRCPFHGWCFGADGECHSIPYATKIPPRAQVGRWPVREVNGAIMVYHRHDGGMPEGEVPVAPEVDDAEWVHLGRFRWQVATHLQEMVDNAADPLHLVHLHGMADPETTVAEGPGRDLTLTTHFLSDPNRIGMPGPPFRARIESHLHGLGMQFIRFDAMAQGLVYLCFTPVDGVHVDARMTLIMKRLPDEATTRFVGELVAKDVTHQFEEDIQVWTHKVYCQQPLLVEGDGPIGRVRRWARQFYPPE